MPLNGLPSLCSMAIGFLGPEPYIDAYTNLSQKLSE